MHKNYYLHWRFNFRYIDQGEKGEKLMNIRMILTMRKDAFFHNEVL